MDQESKDRERIFRAARRSKGHGLFGKDSEERMRYPCGLIHVPASIRPPRAPKKSKWAPDSSWEPRLYSKERTEGIIYGPSNGETWIFVLYKDKTLQRLSYKSLSDPHVFLEEMMISEIPETELEGSFPPAYKPRFDYLTGLLEQQKKNKAIKSRYVPWHYVPKMK